MHSSLTLPEPEALMAKRSLQSTVEYGQCKHERDIVPCSKKLAPRNRCTFPFGSASRLAVAVFKPPRSPHMHQQDE